MAWKRFDWRGSSGMVGDTPIVVWQHYLDQIGNVWSTGELVATVATELERRKARWFDGDGIHGSVLAVSPAGKWSLPIADAVMRAQNAILEAFDDHFGREPFVAEILQPMFGVLEAAPANHVADPAALARVELRLPAMTARHEEALEAAVHEAGENELREVTLTDLRDGRASVELAYDAAGDELRVRLQRCRPGLSLHQAARLVELVYLNAYIGHATHGYARMRVEDGTAALDIVLGRS